MAETLVLIAALAGWAVLYVVPHPLAVLPLLFVVLVGVVVLGITTL